MVHFSALSNESNHVEIRVGLELGSPDQVFTCISLENIAAHCNPDSLLMELLFDFLVFLKGMAGF